MLLTFTRLVAQQNNFGHLNVEHGLSQNSVLAIAQDSSGFLYFGTKNGLNRYDSKNFETFYNVKTLETPETDYINCLKVDKHNVLWVGTVNGLFHMNLHDNKFVPIYFKDHTELNHSSVNVIYQDKKGRIWIGFANGLMRLDNSTGTSYKYFAHQNNANSICSNYITAVYQDNSDNIWVGTNQGLSKITETNNQFSYTNFYASERIGSISDSYVTSIVEDKNSNLWIGTFRSGLNLFDAKTSTFTVFKHTYSINSLVNDNIRTLVTDKKGDLWIGTQEGISKLSIKDKIFTTYKNSENDSKSLSQNSIYSLLIDKDETLWIGTYFGGVNFLYKNTSPFNSDRNSLNIKALSSNVISAILEDNNGIWVCTEGGGLNFIDRKKNTVIVYNKKQNDTNSLGSNLVKTVYKDKNSLIWIGTHGGGLNLLDQPTGYFKKFLYDEKRVEFNRFSVNCLIEDDNNLFYVGTSKGLHVFTKNNRTLIPFEIPTLTNQLKNKTITCFFIDADKKLWIGTERGLYVWHGSDNKISEINLKEKNSVINCIYQDTHKRMLVGIFNNGLYVIDKSGNLIAEFPIQEQLKNKNIVGVIKDKANNIWLTSSNGLYKTDENLSHVNRFTTVDGLPSNTFNNNSIYCTSTSELLFGTYNGLVSLNAQNLHVNNQKYNTVITNVELPEQRKLSLLKLNNINGRNIDALELKHYENSFVLNFALLNYIGSAKNTYSYILEGHEKVYKTTSLNYVSYSQLPSGSYTFRVKGINNDGIEGKEAFVRIVISPPFWKTIWAYTIYLLVVSAFLFFIIRYFYLKALYKKDIELNILKLNFFTNISHEIRTHLSLILGPVESLMMKRDIETKDVYEEKELKIIKENSENLLHLMTELMDFRKAESGNLILKVSEWNIVTFMNSIYESFYDMSITKNIKIDFIASAKNITIYFDKEQLKKVFFNLITNAFKFTDSGGYICILIKEYDKHVSVEIIDNGIGITKENLEKIFTNYYQENDFVQQNTGYGIGLALSKNIVQLHKGTITVESNQQEKVNKTTFTVLLKKGFLHFKKEEIVQNATLLDTEPKGEITYETQINKDEIEVFNKDLLIDKQLKSTLLIADDNEEVRLFIKNFLAEYYNIIEAKDGAEALDLIFETIPDLIISDVMMPITDGYELCNILKNDNRTSHIPIILLTAKAGADNTIEGLENGADVYLTKPYSIQILILNIRNLLASRERMRSRFIESFTHSPLKKEDTTEYEELSTTDNSTIGITYLSKIDEDFIESVIDIINSNIDNTEFDVNTLAKKVAMSKSVLYKKLKAVTNMSINDFIKHIRLKKAAELLMKNEYTIYEVAYMVGFTDRKYFSKEFKKVYDKSPTEFISQIK